MCIEEFDRNLLALIRKKPSLFTGFLKYKQCVGRSHRGCDNTCNNFEDITHIYQRMERYEARNDSRGVVEMLGEICGYNQLWYLCAISQVA